MTRYLLLILLILSASSYASDDFNSKLDKLYGEHEIYEVFFKELQSAVTKHDPESVANLVSYPLRIFGSSEKRSSDVDSSVSKLMCRMTRLST